MYWIININIELPLSTSVDSKKPAKIPNRLNYKEISVKDKPFWVENQAKLIQKSISWFVWFTWKSKVYNNDLIVWWFSLKNFCSLKDRFILILYHLSRSLVNEILVVFANLICLSRLSIYLSFLYANEKKNRHK